MTTSRCQPFIQTNSNSLEWSPISNPHLPPLILNLHSMLRHLNLSIIHQYFLLLTPTRCHLRPPCPLRCYCHSQTNCLVWLALQTRLSSGCCHSQTIHKSVGDKPSPGDAVTACVHNAVTYCVRRIFMSRVRREGGSSAQSIRLMFANGFS